MHLLVFRVKKVSEKLTFMAGGIFFIQNLPDAFAGQARTVRLTGSNERNTNT